MPRRKKQNFDTEKQREELEWEKELYQMSLSNLEHQLSIKYPGAKNAVHNVVVAFNSEINSEIENNILECNSQASPVVTERELVMDIYDVWSRKLIETAAEDQTI